jgi:hypothetical protein
MDETAKQLLRDTHQPLPMEPGRVQRRDYEYERGGVVNLFMFLEPLAGRRWVDVTEQRTKVDWAHQIKELVDQRYPEAEQIVLVMDNLNTHTPASLYEAFDPREARRLAEKLEIHYTPKHGSWLNMAEIELSAFERDLPERVSDASAMACHVSAWEKRRNGAKVKADWQFTTPDARVKLRKLYPTVDG